MCIFITCTGERDDREGAIMAIEKVREYFKKMGIENRIMEFEVSSATVKEAAEAI